MKNRILKHVLHLSPLELLQTRLPHVLHLSPLELFQTRLPFPKHLQALLALFKTTVAGQRLPLSLVQVDDVVQRVLELVDGSL